VVLRFFLISVGVLLHTFDECFCFYLPLIKGAWACLDAGKGISDPGSKASFVVGDHEGTVLVPLLWVDVFAEILVIGGDSGAS
jgi:hypothetical protein